MGDNVRMPTFGQRVLSDLGRFADRLLSGEKTPEANMRIASGNLPRDWQANSHSRTVFHCPTSRTCLLRRLEALG